MAKDIFEEYAELLPEKLIEEAREEQKIPKHLYVNGQKTDLKYENGQVEGDGVYSYFCMPSKILLEGKDVDTETIINSVRKTGKCVIVQESPRTLGLAAEIIARINDKALYSLEAAVERVTGFDTIVPLRLHEDYYLPSVGKIVAAVERVMRNAKEG